MLSLLLYRGGGSAKTAHSGNVRLWLIELYEREFAEQEARRRAEQAKEANGEPYRTAEVHERTQEVREVRQARQPKLPAPAPLPRDRRPAESPPRPVARLLAPSPAARQAAEARETTRQVLEALAKQEPLLPIQVKDYAAEQRAAREREEEEELVLFMMMEELDD